MSRRLAIMIAVSSTINMALVIVGRGSGGQFIVVIVAFWIALISAFIGSLALLIVRMGWAPQALRWFATRAISIGIVAGSCLVSVPIGFLVSRYDVGQAMSFCDRLRPALERHRHATGRYPESVSEVSRDDLPWLLRGVGFYRPSGDGYSFMFWDPSAMMSGFASDNRTVVWHEFD